MKKISALVITLICLFSVFFSGCTYADNATLLTIEEKYNYIANKNSDFFNGDRFIPIYNSDKLNNVIINSQYDEYTALKTDNLDSIFTNRGAYGVLMQAVNSSYCSMNNAFNIISNNDLTEKKYKKQMYLSLESLQKNLKKLDTSKRSLESSFNNNSGSSLEISQQGLVKHNLNNYKIDLNKCLGNLLNFNKNLTDALNNNIEKPIELNDLLYNSENIIVTNWNNNMLINNFNMVASNYILNYSINIENNILNAKDLIDVIATLLDIQATLPSENLTSEKIIDEYKIVRTLEDTIIKKEKVLNNNVSILNSNNLDNPNDAQQNALNNLEYIYGELIGYGNKLIEYFQF